MRGTVKKRPVAEIFTHKGEHSGKTFYEVRYSDHKERGYLSDITRSPTDARELARKANEGAG